MKNRVFILSAIAVAAAALVSCEKDQDITTSVEKKGVPFELTVGTPETKTTNSGMSTVWKADDKINLFHAEKDTDVYSENDEFTITSENLDSKVFTGTLASALDPAKSYDWYALYPYNAGFTTPANTTCEMSLSGKDRTQTGYGSTAHLSGLPLVGKASNVAAAEKPSITMNNMMAVVKIVVTNTLEAPLTVTGVSITAPKKIVGNFIVNFSDPSAPSYTDGTFCYNTAKLKVNSGTALAQGDQAVFYIPIKPIDLALGEHLIIKVNTQEEDKIMPSAFSFRAGKITTINFDYDKTFTPQVFSLASSITAGDKVIFASGKANGDVKVMGRYSSGNNIPAVAGTVYNEHITTSSSMGVYTVGGDGSAGYTFYDADNEVYLNATSAKSNNLKGVAETDEWDKWGVTITSGIAEILNKGTDKTTYHIRFNSSSNIFSAYTSAQTTICLYKLTAKSPVSLSFANSEISKTTANYGEFTGQVATSSPAVSGITYAISGDDIGSITAATGAVVLNGTEGTATVTATYAGDETHAPASASYSITVVGTNLVPTFTFTSCPTGWPSGSNNTAIQALKGGSYTYTVSERSYTFVLSDDVGYHSGKYLAIMNGKYVGLPKLSGYKLTKAVVGNSSGCSTSATVRITTDTAGETNVSGGAAQTLSTRGSTYTYTLSGTANNTMYYLHVTGNTQIISLNLTYEEVE